MFLYNFHLLLVCELMLHWPVQHNFEPLGNTQVLD